MDFFTDQPVSNEANCNSQERLDDTYYGKHVWQEKRVRSFFENNLGLSASTKILGRIVSNHDGALYFWEELINQEKLTVPFSVLHIDAHADLGFGCIGNQTIVDTILSYPREYRKTRFCDGIEDDGRFLGINMCNYLLFALAFGWVSDLTYCTNTLLSSLDISKQFIDYSVKQRIDNGFETQIVLRKTDGSGRMVVPFRIIKQSRQFKCDREFDYVVLAQSPSFTPVSADYIMDVFRDYIIEI